MNKLAETLAAVATETGVRVEHITSRRRTERICKARFEVYRRLHEHGWNFSEIAREMGRDHSTITSGIKRARGNTMSERGEISVAVILLLTFLSGLGITIVGVNYDHALRREDAEKTRRAMSAEQAIDWEAKDFNVGNPETTNENVKL